MTVKEDAAELARARREDEYHLDGNALGGTLADVFGRDVTDGEARCGACGAHNAMGALVAYGRSVLACPGCGAVLLVVVHRPGGYRVTFGDLHSLQLSET